MARGCLQKFVSMKLRVAFATLFLMLAAWQPALTAASVAPDAAIADNHHHGEEASGASHHDSAEAGADDHHPSVLDTCCEMHCVMSQAMPSAPPMIIAPACSTFAADFTHALPDGCYAAVIKPPRTTS